MALVDGHRTLDEICNDSPLNRHDALNRLAQLQLAGLIVKMDKKPEPQTGHLEDMISELSQMFEGYLTEKTAKTNNRMQNRMITQTLVGEESGESN